MESRQQKAFLGHFLGRDKIKKREQHNNAHQ